MKDEKKYLGMTKMQIGILAGLTVVLMLVVGTGGWLVLGGDGLGFSQRSLQTVAPTVTSIVVIPSTLTPTITPTPIPYEQLIPPDWKQYKTSLIEIWLPSNFKETTKKKSDLLNNFAFVELLATEVLSKTSAYSMQVAVTYDLMSADTLDEHLKSKLPHLPYQAQITDSRSVYVNTVEAHRFVIEYRADNVDFNDLVYVFQDGETVWYVQYAAEISEYFTNLPMFEQSIQTFRVVQ